MLTPKTTILFESKIHDKEVVKEEVPMKNFWLKYPIPCKNLVDKRCEMELYAVNWLFTEKTSHKVRYMYNGDLKENKIPSLYSTVLEMLSEVGNISPSEFDKYENTIQFVKKCLEIEENIELKD